MNFISFFIKKDLAVNFSSFTFEAKRRESENFAKRKRKMGYSIGEMTAKELAKKEGVTVRAIGIPFAKLHREGNPLFPVPFSQSLQLSPEQIEVLRPKRAPVKKTRTDTATQAVNIAMIDAGRPNEVAPNVVPLRRWPLWAALAITAGASVPNMVEVTVAIKGSAPTAYALTAVFTAVPALLIAARLRGFLWGVSVAGAMGYTAFCNASAVFGGLTALDKGYILQPTVFLEAVTNMLNTDYLNTARAIAAFTALIIGAVEFVAVKNLSR